MLRILQTFGQLKIIDYTMWCKILLITACLEYISGQSDPWDEVPIILDRIKDPSFPLVLYNIINFGAIPSPINDIEAPSVIVDANTNAFKNAIGNCTANGGGIVVVPPGTFITSAITLRSNVSLQVNAGATIRFTRDTSKYPIVFTRWEGVELMNYSPFIYAFEEENIAITGLGVIDGNCDCTHWWNWKGPSSHCPNPSLENQTLARARLFQMGEDDVPVEQRIFGEGDFLRPQFIQPYRSKNVVIEGVTLTRSPMWVVHPVLCENVIIRNINISSHGPNSDGVDPESCKDVWLKGVIFDSGDDDIAIKSGRNADGRRINVPTENVVIQDCQMVDGHGGITLGSEISGGVRNVFAENCYMSSPELDTAIRIKNNALRGGLLEKFYVRNIRVGTVGKQVVEVDFFYEEGPDANFVPIIREMIIQNMTLEGGAPYSLYVRGFPQHPNTSYVGLRLENVTFNGLINNPHYVIQNVDDLVTVNVVVDGELWNYN